MKRVPVELSERLLPAAAVFAARGFDETRVEDLARVTGIPRATLYYYFSGKEDILAHLLTGLLQQVAEAVAEAIDSPGSAIDRLDAVIRAQLRVLAANPDTCQVLLAELGRAGRLPDTAEAIEHAFHRPVHRLLDEGVRAGSMRSVPKDSAVSAIFGAVVLPGLHHLVLHGSLDADRVADEVLPLLLHGLAQSPTARRPRRRGPARG